MQRCRRCGQENPEGFRLCGMCGNSLGTEEPERRKLVTLLFCDMSGSTALGESVDAESVRDLMFRYFDEMRSLIERHGGTVEKFIGDAVMAVFGVPQVHEDDALRAVRAASEMQERLTSLNQEFGKRFGATIALRIGLNTGEAVAGDSSAHQALVTGDAVNVAARLEQAAAPGEVLLGEGTYRLVRSQASVEPIEPLQAKGKAERVAAYRLLGLQGDTSKPQARLDRKMVGRESERGVLERSFSEAVSERRCTMVTVTGEPGVGKSRLAAELVSIVDGRATVLSGRCLSYGEGITFWPLAEMIRDAAGIRDDDTQESARARLLALLEDVKQGTLVAARVAQALGLASGSASADQIASAIRQLFEKLAGYQPLLLIVDDLQWAEPTLVDVLYALVENSEDAPIMLLCLARAEWLEDGRAREPIIRLAPLDADETEELVERLLGGEELDPGLASRIRTAAGGNPLFVEALLAMIRESGEEDIAIPPTINALLAARLEQLQAGERTVVERGSIEGQVFHHGALVELCPAAAGDGISTALDALTDKDFVQPAEASLPNEEAFRFRHMLIREAAYATVPKKLRAELHGKLSGWLERRAGDRMVEYEEILGYHLEQAYRYRAELGPVDVEGRELARAAARRLASAGQRALARGDLPAARNLFGRTSTLLPPTDPIRLTLLPDRGAALGYQLESEYRKRLTSGQDDEKTRQLGRTAAERLVSAGRRAVDRGDMPAAVNLLAKAASLLPKADPLQVDVLPTLVEALVQTGEAERAAALQTEYETQATLSQSTG